mgnify:CR=1 FL=1
MFKSKLTWQRKKRKYAYNNVNSLEFIFMLCSYSIDFDISNASNHCFSFFWDRNLARFPCTRRIMYVYIYTHGSRALNLWRVGLQSAVNLPCIWTGSMPLRVSIFIHFIIIYRNQTWRTSNCCHLGVGVGGVGLNFLFTPMPLKAHV